MKKKLTKLLLLAAVFGVVKTAGAADRWETLRAINWVENPTNQTRVGRFGELGPYQFRPATWRMHTDKPFRLAVQRDASDEIAVKHYEWIKRNFERAGVAVSPFNIALAWNCGVEAVISGRTPSASYSYAERVNNLVETFRERQRDIPDRETLTYSNTPEPTPAADRSGLRFRVLQDTPSFVIAAG